MNIKMFSPKQLKCIELLALGELSNAKIANIVGINASTVCLWKLNREGFMEAVVARSRELLREELPEVYKALKSRSKKGNHNHIKIYLDHVEKLEEIRAGKTSITFTWEPPTPTGNTNE